MPRNIEIEKNEDSPLDPKPRPAQLIRSAWPGAPTAKPTSLRISGPNETSIGTAGAAGESSPCCAYSWSRGTFAFSSPGHDIKLVGYEMARLLGTNVVFGSRARCSRSI